MFLTRIRATTSMTAGSCRHVTPTLANSATSGRLTVSTGRPGTSSPDNGTSFPAPGDEAPAEDVGTGGAVDPAVGDADRLACTSASSLTTASRAGSVTEPSSISSMAVGIGFGSPLVSTLNVRSVPVITRKARKHARMRRTGLLR
ncbi:hypothetical protein [Blastococcus brunescens]|uniref:Uncharacterized protein n=1 Tax=Blastococcus brunescens TaxID=1564165 RepID=A0ABZ1AZQ2_9ACTN|nr:hypothetical protein [Blastococcus sp. BMG 8361]WRL62933.1 hypothetical protein U6N30_24185 [Blastococcus sp. BMG 8361]